MIETQMLMTVSDFFCFFLEIISWKGASLFNDGGLFFRWGGLHFEVGGGGAPWGASVLMGGLQKNL